MTGRGTKRKTEPRSALSVDAQGGPSRGFSLVRPLSPWGMIRTPSRASLGFSHGQGEGGSEGAFGSPIRKHRSSFSTGEGEGGGHGVLANFPIIATINGKALPGAKTPGAHPGAYSSNLPPPRLKPSSRDQREKILALNGERTTRVSHVHPHQFHLP